MDTWEGLPISETRTEHKGGKAYVKRCYNGVTVERHGKRMTWGVGDFVLLQSGDEDNPYIARIRALWDAEDEGKFLEAQWMYKRDDLKKGSVPKDTGPDEIFLTRHVDPNGLESVVSSVRVLLGDDSGRRVVSALYADGEDGVGEGRTRYRCSQMYNHLSGFEVVKFSPRELDELLTVGVIRQKKRTTFNSWSAELPRPVSVSLEMARSASGAVTSANSAAAPPSSSGKDAESERSSGSPPVSPLAPSPFERQSDNKRVRTTSFDEISLAADNNINDTASRPVSTSPQPAPTPSTFPTPPPSNTVQAKEMMSPRTSTQHITRIGSSYQADIPPFVFNRVRPTSDGSILIWSNDGSVPDSLLIEEWNKRRSEFKIGDIIPVVTRNDKDKNSPFAHMWARVGGTSAAENLLYVTPYDACWPQVSHDPKSFKFKVHEVSQVHIEDVRFTETFMEKILRDLYAAAAEAFGGAVGAMLKSLPKPRGVSEVLSEWNEEEVDKFFLLLKRFRSPSESVRIRWIHEASKDIETKTPNQTAELLMLLLGGVGGVNRSHPGSFSCSKCNIRDSLFVCCRYAFCGFRVCKECLAGLPTSSWWNSGMMDRYSLENKTGLMLCPSCCSKEPPTPASSGLGGRASRPKLIVTHDGYDSTCAWSRRRFGPSSGLTVTDAVAALSDVHQKETSLYNGLMDVLLAYNDGQIDAVRAMDVISKVVSKSSQPAIKAVWESIHTHADE